MSITIADLAVGTSVGNLEDLREAQELIEKIAKDQDKAEEILNKFYKGKGTTTANETLEEKIDTALARISQLIPHTGERELDVRLMLDQLKKKQMAAESVGTTFGHQVFAALTPGGKAKLSEGYESETAAIEDFNKKVDSMVGLMGQAKNFTKEDVDDLRDLLMVQFEGRHGIKYILDWLSKMSTPPEATFQKMIMEKLQAYIGGSAEVVRESQGRMLALPPKGEGLIAELQKMGYTGIKSGFQISEEQYQTLLKTFPEAKDVFDLTTRIDFAIQNIKDLNAALAGYKQLLVEREVPKDEMNKLLAVAKAQMEIAGHAHVEAAVGTKSKSMSQLLKYSLKWTPEQREKLFALGIGAEFAGLLYGIVGGPVTKHYGARKGLAEGHMNISDLAEDVGKVETESNTEIKNGINALSTKMDEAVSLKEIEKVVKKETEDVKEEIKKIKIEESNQRPDNSV